MKNIISTILLSLFLIVPTFSQSDNSKNQNEINKLNQEILSLYQAGKLEQAIEISDKAVKLAKKDDLTDKFELAILSATSARLKKEMFQKLLQQIYAGQKSKEEYQKMRKELDGYAIDAEKDYEDAIKIFDDLKSDSQQAAAAKGQFAWILYKHPGKPQQKIITDPNKLERFEKAEKLYLESIDSYDKTLGQDSDSSLIASFDIGEFYLTWSKFEKAIPFYERFIKFFEKKYGSNQQSLVPALRALAEIAVMTEKETEADTLAKKINAITGKEETPEPIFNLQLRKKFSASKTQVLVETIRPEDLTSGFETYNNRLAILRGGRRGEPDTKYNHSENSSFSIKNRTVMVEVLIDEKGEVEEAKAVFDENKKDSIKKLKQESEKAVKGWKFEPFEYKGEKRKMRGFVFYVTTKVG